MSENNIDNKNNAMVDGEGENNKLGKATAVSNDETQQKSQPEYNNTNTNNDNGDNSGNNNNNNNKNNNDDKNGGNINDNDNDRRNDKEKQKLSLSQRRKRRSVSDHQHFDLSVQLPTPTDRRKALSQRNILSHSTPSPNNSTSAVPLLASSSDSLPSFSFANSLTSGKPATSEPSFDLSTGNIHPPTTTSARHSFSRLFTSPQETERDSNTFVPRITSGRFTINDSSHTRSHSSQITQSPTHHRSTVPRVFIPKRSTSARHISSSPPPPILSPIATFWKQKRKEDLHGSRVFRVSTSPISSPPRPLSPYRGDEAKNYYNASNHTAQSPNDNYNSINMNMNRSHTTTSNRTQYTGSPVFGKRLTIPNSTDGSNISHVLDNRMNSSSTSSNALAHPQMEWNSLVEHHKRLALQKEHEFRRFRQSTKQSPSTSLFIASLPQRTVSLPGSFAQSFPLNAEGNDNVITDSSVHNTTMNSASLLHGLHPTDSPQFHDDSQRNQSIIRLNVANKSEIGTNVNDNNASTNGKYILYGTNDNNQLANRMQEFVGKDDVEMTELKALEKSEQRQREQDEKLEKLGDDLDKEGKSLGGDNGAGLGFLEMRRASLSAPDSGDGKYLHGENMDHSLSTYTLTDMILTHDVLKMDEKSGATAPAKWRRGPHQYMHPINRNRRKKNDSVEKNVNWNDDKIQSGIKGFPYELLTAIVTALSTNQLFHVLVNLSDIQETVADRSMPVLAKNVVLSVGSGDMGQLGLGAEIQERKNVTVVKTLLDKNVVKVACGAIHNAVLTSAGDVWTWGCNDDGALGREDDEYLPEKVQLRERIVDIACGDCHTIALAEDGRVYSWGLYKDLSGVMGFSKKIQKQNTPALIPFPKGQRITQIAAGENHVLALTDDFTVYEWGDIRVGLRQSERKKLDKLEPRAVSFRFRPRTHVLKVFAFGFTNFVLTQDDRVYAWGLNNFGQCGLGHTNLVGVPTLIPEISKREVVKITGGTHHTIALTRDHCVYAFGKGMYGRLGLGDDKDRTSPTLIESLKSLNDGDYVIDIACGESHSMAITKLGKLYTWGYGDLLQLGNGEEKDEYLPRQVVGQQLINLERVVVQVDGGAQHSVVLAKPNPEKTQSKEQQKEQQKEDQEKDDRENKMENKDEKEKE